jgi:hypothetical protein
MGVVVGLGANARPGRPRSSSSRTVTVTSREGSLIPDFYQASAYLVWLLDERECVAEVGRERVFGGEDVLAGADLYGAVAAGGTDELLD